MNGADIKHLFDNKWGWFRKFIAANPLTGFWIGVASGSGIVGAAWKLFG